MLLLWLRPYRLDSSTLVAAGCQLFLCSALVAGILISVIEDVKSAVGVEAARDALGIDSSVVWSVLVFSFMYFVLACAALMVVVELYRKRRDLAEAAARVHAIVRRLSKLPMDTQPPAPPIASVEPHPEHSSEHAAALRRSSALMESRANACGLMQKSTEPPKSMKSEDEENPSQAPTASLYSKPVDAMVV